MKGNDHKILQLMPELQTPEGLQLGTSGSSENLLGFLLIGVTGSLSFAYLTIQSTIVQFSTADSFRGRVMSIHQWTWGSTALGGFLIGMTASYYNPQIAVTIFGAVTLIVITMFYWWANSKFD